MRLRNESLPTGYLLTSGARSESTASLMLLVAGPTDIEPLQSIIHLSQSIDGLIGIDVSDQRRLDALGLDIDPSRVVRIEAREFAGLSQQDLNLILQPAINRLLAGNTEIFPSAGGAVGGVAEGIQFLDREEDLDNVITAVRAGRDVLIRAPRRSGKTSLLRAIERESRGEFTTRYVDFQRDRNLAGTAARFLASVSGRALRTGARRVDEVGWEAAFLEAVKQMGSTRAERKVLLLDELVLLFDVYSSDHGETISLAEEALAGFQKIRNETGVQFIFAGSLDLLDYLRDRLGITNLPPMFRDAVTHPLRPLAERCLTGQLRRLLLGSQLVLEDGDLDWLRDNFDIAVPYPAQVFLEKLTHAVRTCVSIAPSGIENLLTTFLKETDAFRELESHLDRANPRRKATVTKALDTIARTPVHEGAALAEISASLAADDFTWMIETFPLMVDGSRVRPASRLWRRWWRIQAGAES